ncbi:MAG: hypothetical protein A2506_12760 [Elusimicrobia bacterium RIFOXYD12_FULL_66_9]|nr:MAG: hypothetical protein A2506_12760 [Elusimicrobia bacterium RIFOXYD12_FULL_66_9]
MGPGAFLIIRAKEQGTSRETAQAHGQSRDRGRGPAVEAEAAHAEADQLLGLSGGLDSHREAGKDQARGIAHRPMMPFPGASGQ